MSIHTNPPIRLLMAYQQRYPNTQPQVIVQPPGREIWAAAALNSSWRYSILALDLRPTLPVTFTRQSALRSRSVIQRPLPRWSRYPAGVMLRLSDTNLDVPGFDVIICGDEPPGPRYEHALGIVFAALWYEFSGQAYDTAHLFEISEQVRREYVEGKL